MTTVILVIHVLIAVAMVAVVLVQRSDGGALGGLGGGAFGGVMSGRQSANLLTRTTAVLAGAFMTTSMVLAIFASGTSGPRSIADEIPVSPGADPVMQGAEDPVTGVTGVTGPQVPVAE